MIVADEVGLGKTFIAGELIYEASVTRRQKVLVIAPATLRDSTWEPFLRDKNLRADVVSYEQLAGDIADRRAQSTRRCSIPDEYAMVIVDEAHAMRNAVTRRADALRELLAGSAPKDLVLLTATPVNNSLYDLYTLISYFVPERRGVRRRRGAVAARLLRPGDGDQSRRPVAGASVRRHRPGRRAADPPVRQAPLRRRQGGRSTGSSRRSGSPRRAC